MSATTVYASIPLLLEVPPCDRDLPWLKEALQWAIELELATLPPYLCARWSISKDAGGAVTELRKISQDEMDHMGNVANLLVAIGGKPVMKGAAVPRYPTELPGGVHPGVRVRLGAFTCAQLRLFMKIEEPAQPLPLDMNVEETFDTIGLFYKAILEAFQCLKPTITRDGQVDAARVVSTLKDVEDVIEQISLEGEGQSDTPYYKGKLTHHYVFGEYYHGYRIKEISPGLWRYAGDRIPAAEALELTGPAPANEPNNVAFNGVYTTMLNALHATWNGEDRWDDAVKAMRALASRARAVMSGGFWPTFTYLKA